MKKSTVTLLLALVAVMLPASPALAACPDPGGGRLPNLPDLTDDIVFRGRGHGHGTGMSQYGAKGAAALGCNHAQILSTYYPGTELTSRAASGFRLSLNTASLKTTVRAEGGSVRWQVCSPGGNDCTVVHTQPRGETWIARVVQDTTRATAALRIERLVGTTWHLVQQHAEDRQLRVVMTSVNDDALGPAVAFNDGSRTRTLARGVVEIDPNEDGSDTAFVTLLIGMEQYLYGLGEVPSSWPAEALRAQAIAARTYAYDRIDGRPVGSSTWKKCRCHLYSTTVDQNYVGYAKESETANGIRYGAQWVKAVRDTGNRVVYYKGEPIPAFYSALHGGSSESYAFWSGGASRSYLQSVDDSAWEAAGKAPLSAWALGVTAERLGAVLKIGTVIGVSTPNPKGADGRIGRPDAGFGGVTVHGTGGKSWTGSGSQLRDALAALGPDCGTRTSAGRVQRLCSTMFEVRVNLGPPPVPPPAGAVRVSGDWDGDGVDTPGWFKDGQWGLHSAHSAGGSTRRLAYGQKGDIPVVGDWDGDGIDTLGVVRGNQWILRNEYRRGAEDIVMRYGEPGDSKVVGDWDGNGTDTLGIVRGNLWVLRNRYVRGAKDVVMRYGEAGDAKVVGDWDGNGTDTLGVVRGNLWVLRNRYVRNAEDVVMRYGEPADVKVTGDWDGDGTSTLGIVRGDVWVLRNRYVKNSRDVTFEY